MIKKTYLAILSAVALGMGSTQLPVSAQPDFARSSAQVSDTFNDPDVLQLIGPQSSVPAVSLDVNSKLAEQAYFSITVNRMRQKINVDGQEILFAPIMGSSSVLLKIKPKAKSVIEAWIYVKRGASQELVNKSAPITLDTNWWGSRKIQMNGFMDKGVVSSGLQNLDLKSTAKAPSELLTTAYPLPRAHVKIEAVYDPMAEGEQPMKMALVNQFQPLHATPKIALDAPLEPGKHDLTIKIGNAWGGYQTWKGRVFYMGFNPPAQTFLAVDKAAMKCYLVKEGKLTNMYDIGVGAETTPTTSGYYVTETVGEYDPNSLDPSEMMEPMSPGEEVMPEEPGPQPGDPDYDPLIAELEGRAVPVDNSSDMSEGEAAAEGEAAVVTMAENMPEPQMELVIKLSQKGKLTPIRFHLPKGGEAIGKESSKDGGIIMRKADLEALTTALNELGGAAYPVVIKDDLGGFEVTAGDL